ncbi:MAG: hypothetical protein QXG10_02320 [Candidatus Hadarchaeales archaeon]
MEKKVEKMRAYFDALEDLRESILEDSREVVRASSRSISAIHRGELKAAATFLSTARKKLQKLQAQAKRCPEFIHSGIVESAQQEYCEAKLMNEFAKRGEIPGPDEVGVPYRPYLNGLADMVGELRRTALDMMRDGRVAEAGRVLEVMEKILENLMDFDYPDAILPGMKRRQDMVRGVVEKTRGDLTIAIRQHRLEKELRRSRR